MAPDDVTRTTGAAWVATLSIIDWSWPSIRSAAARASPPAGADSSSGAVQPKVSSALLMGGAPVAEGS